MEAEIFILNTINNEYNVINVYADAFVIEQKRPNQCSNDNELIIDILINGGVISKKYGGVGYEVTYKILRK